MPSTPSSATLLVVGDVHRHWTDADRAFIEDGDQDLVLFVGDLGDEDVQMVQEVAALQSAKAVILGNHDAWQSFSNRQPTKRLRASLEALQGDHVAYAVREVPRGAISIVGARPFSWGGPRLRSPEIYQDLYAVVDMESSAERIFDVARRAQHRDLVVLAHNGPTGLSEETQDIYGKDFGRDVGGDWGDPDLEQAIDMITERGWRVPCVIAGHMHHRVHVPKGAQRCRFVKKGPTLYVNPAVVPRVRPLSDGAQVAHFMRMAWSDGCLERLEEIWVDSSGRIREITEPDIREL